MHQFPLISRHQSPWTSWRQVLRFPCRSYILCLLIMYSVVYSCTRLFQDLFTLLLYKLVSGRSRLLPGDENFLAGAKAPVFGEYHSSVISRVHLVDLVPRSFLLMSNECSPGEYTGLLIVVAEDSLQMSVNSLFGFPPFLLLPISFIALLYFFVMAAILTLILEWNESTKSFISVMRVSL